MSWPSLLTYTLCGMFCLLLFFYRSCVGTASVRSDQESSAAMDQACLPSPNQPMAPQVVAIERCQQIKKLQDIDLERSIQVRLLQEKYLPQAHSSQTCTSKHQTLLNFSQKELASLNLSAIKDADMTAETCHWLKKLSQPEHI